MRSREFSTLELKTNIYFKKTKGGGEIRRHVYIIWLKKDEFCAIVLIKKEVIFMKSYELKPTRENILDAILRDTIGRSKDVFAFADIFLPGSMKNPEKISLCYLYFGRKNATINNGHL